MHIMKIGNYSSSLNPNYGVKKNNSVSTPNFGARVNKNLFERALNYDFSLMSKYLTQDTNGNLPIHFASLEKLQEIHKELKNQPEIIAQMYLTPNIIRELPIHNANLSLEKMQEIFDVLENQPKVIAKMLLTPNHNGRLPLNSLDQSRESEKAKTIHLAIVKAALNSDLDVETSIKLLETYNHHNRYSNAIEELKKQI